MKIGVITASWVYKLSNYDSSTPWGEAQGKFESWTTDDLDALLATIKSLGFGHVELWHATGGFGRWNDQQIAALKKSLQKHGLELASYCVGGIEPASDIDNLFSYAHRLGASMCTGYLSNQDLDRRAAELGKAGEKYGIRYGIENHGPQHTVSTPEDIRALADRYPGLIGACPDTGIYYRGGVDPLEVVRALKDIIIHTHLKDVDDSGQCAVGEGKVPMAEIITTLRDAGYPGVYSVEREGGGDPEPVLRKSAEFIKRVLSS